RQERWLLSNSEKKKWATFGTFYTVSQIDPPSATLVELDKQADLMQRVPSTRLLITGHTCNLGSYERNILIGQLRAEAAKAYLAKLGIDPRRILTQSLADFDPILPNTSEANRKVNRCIELTIFTE
ncbi:MAG: OmpA family protein, partial [Prevotellaceae bacterium]|nr:OmpA family protein [Prevotellaceae bacterium]